MLLRIETQQAELKLKQPVGCLFICRRPRAQGGTNLKSTSLPYETILSILSILSTGEI